MVHPGFRGPPGLPGPSMIVDVIKGRAGFSGRKGEPGQQGHAGNGAVTSHLFFKPVVFCFFFPNSEQYRNI